MRSLASERITYIWHRVNDVIVVSRMCLLCD